jgi:hypothetical protein
VHLRLQPAIDGLLALVVPGGPLPDDLPARLRPLRVRRKRLATGCFFLVLLTIVLGLQVYARFAPAVTAGLVGLAALFA